MILPLFEPFSIRTDADDACRGAKQPGKESFVEVQILKTVLPFLSLFALDVLDPWIVGKIIDQYLGLHSGFVTYFGDGRWLMIPCRCSLRDISPVGKILQDGSPVAVFLQSLKRLFDDDGITFPGFFLLLGEE